MLLGGLPWRAAERVLFIGNSFTFGSGSAVRFYRNDTVTDLNDEGIGGVPALFKSFADQAGLDYDVALETRGGTGLDFHLAEKRDLIARRGWDIVVAHGYSTLDADAPRDPTKLVATSRELAELLRAKNRDVELYLMATWSRADQVYPAEGAWAGRPIEAMATDIRAAYDAGRGRRRRQGDPRRRGVEPRDARPASPIRIRTTASTPASSTFGPSTTTTRAPTATTSRRSSSSAA